MSLRLGERTFGTLSLIWPPVFHELSESEEAYLRETAERLSVRLGRLADNGVSMTPPRFPLVMSGQSEAVAEDGRLSPREEQRSLSHGSASFVFHLRMLGMALMGATRTRDAAALTIERLINGFQAQAVAISLTEADRLHVVAASGCPKEYLKSLNGMHIGKSSPETEAIVQRRVVFEPQEEALPRGDGQTADSRDELTWVVIPLIAGDHALGSCSIGFTPERGLIAAEETPLSSLSTLLGETLERTQLYDAQYALSQKLQQALLPRMLPQLAGVLTTSRYEPPAGGIELGGDWYDLISLPDGGVAAVIGDVQGHNIAAAVAMGQLRSAVHGYALEGHDPSTVLYRTNRLLIDLDTELFATCACVWLDPATGTAQVVSAGHPRPLMCSVRGACETAVADIGVPLGVEDNPSYQASVHTLDPGTLLVLYTDGLSGRQGELAQETVEAALAGSGVELEVLGDRLMESGAGQAPRADDAALMLLRYEGPSRQVNESVRRLHVHRHDLQGVRRARRLLNECLETWHLESLTDSAEVVTSEVVTNALVHADSDLDVCLRRYPGRLRVEVRDSDTHPAMLVDLGADKDKAEGGRGLLIVSALASSWGNSPSGRGKTVWFEIQAMDP
ncbi:SpoIIE family protein phosphatase [Streptomyces sp. 6N106]|uniref:SpoIIE family protein phosphatase n=1 Tax=Streptomyces sp. 6N106 TaxID=3457418 RepID=UPI003FD0E047